MTKSLALTPDNQTFKLNGVAVSIYTDGEVAAVTVGMCVARFTSPDKLRELAAGLLATAEQLETKSGKS